MSPIAWMVVVLGLMVGAKSVAGEPPSGLERQEGTRGGILDPFAVNTDDGRGGSGMSSFRPPDRGTVPEPVRPAPVLPSSPHLSPLLTPGDPRMPAIVPPTVGSPGTGFWRR